MQEVRLTIKELSERLQVHVNTLRSWEKDLDITVPRSKNSNRSRYYTNDEIVIFTKVAQLRDEKMSMDNIKRFLNKDLVSLEQEETAIESLPLSEISTVEIKNMIASIIIERETALKEEFKKEIKEELKKQEESITEKIIEKQLEQIQAENSKLIKYIDKNRELDKNKGLFNSLKQAVDNFFSRKI